MNKRPNAWYLLLMLFLRAGFSVAQDSPTVEIRIHCTAQGVPVPTMTLERSEVEEYRRLLDQFAELREDEKMVYRSKSGSYWGLNIEEWSPGDRMTRRRIFGARIYSNIIIDERQPYGYEFGWWRSRFMAPDNALEHYILSLALDKRVISEDVYRAILNNVLVVAPQKEDPKVIKRPIMAVKPTGPGVVVQIHCFSGMPDPVMRLEPSEEQEYRRLLSQFRALQEDEKERQPINSFYGGLTIKQYDPSNIPASDFRLYGKRILGDPQPDEHGVGRWRTEQLAPDDSLELYLLGLARDKGVIDEEVYQVALKGIGMRK